MAATFLDNFNGAVGTLITDHVPDIGTGPYISLSNRWMEPDSYWYTYGSVIADWYGASVVLPTVTLNGNGQVDMTALEYPEYPSLYLHPADIQPSPSCYFETEVDLDAAEEIGWSLLQFRQSVRCAPMPAVPVERGYEFWNAASIEYSVEYTKDTNSFDVRAILAYGANDSYYWWDRTVSSILTDWKSFNSNKITMRVEVNDAWVTVFVNGFRMMFLGSADGRARLIGPYANSATEFFWGERHQVDNPYGYHYLCYLTRLELGTLSTGPQAFWTNRVKTTEQDA